MQEAIYKAIQVATKLQKLNKIKYGRPKYMTKKNRNADIADLADIHWIYCSNKMDFNSDLFTA